MSQKGKKIKHDTRITLSLWWDLNQKQLYNYLPTDSGKPSQSEQALIIQINLTVIMI